MGSLRESEFVSLCQKVMTGLVVMTQNEFFKKVSKILYPKADPITNYIVKEIKAPSVYALITSLSSNPMRIPLSHAMGDTFLISIKVTYEDVFDLMKKSNEEYFDRTTSSCMFYKHYALHNDCRGSVLSVIFMYGDRYGVEQTLTVPFKEEGTTTEFHYMYVDLESVQNRPKNKKTKLSVENVETVFDAWIPNNKILDVKTPIGKCLAEYHEIYKNYFSSPWEAVEGNGAIIVSNEIFAQIENMIEDGEDASEMLEGLSTDD